MVHMCFVKALHVFVSGRASILVLCPCTLLGDSRSPCLVLVCFGAGVSSHRPPSACVSGRLEGESRHVHVRA